MDASAGFALVIGLSVLFALCYALGINERVKRTLSCPITGAEADVEVVQRYGKPSKAVRVANCSLLPRPNRVDCGQECLRDVQ